MFARRPVIVLILIGTVGILMPHTAKADVIDGLVARWSFDGTGNDVSSNGYDLTLVGDPGFAAGRFGQAVVLGGDGSQYAIRPVNDAAFNFGASDFTVQIWANFSSRNPGEQTLIEKFSGGGGPGWTLTTPGCDTQFYSRDNGSGGFQMDSGACLPTDQWLQFVVMRSGSDFTLRLNGTVIAAATFGGSLSASLDPLLIGRRNAQDGRNFNVNGRLDDAAIWNRALSQDEIEALYNTGFDVPEPASIWLAVSLLGATLLRRCRKERAARD